LLNTAVDAGIPVLVFVAMVVVGMELTLNDFRPVARQPRIIVAATVGQIVLLPVIGLAPVTCLMLFSATRKTLSPTPSC
jgi:BASS family bile acid:Na+ symporter